MPKDKTDKVAEDLLNPLVKHFAKHGGISELAARITKRAGRSFSRQQIEQYLNTDKEKRIQPRLGLGIVLVEEGKQMIAEHGQKAAP